MRAWQNRSVHKRTWTIAGLLLAVAGCDDEARSTIDAMAFDAGGEDASSITTDAGVCGDGGRMLLSEIGDETQPLCQILLGHLHVADAYNQAGALERLRMLREVRGGGLSVFRGDFEDMRWLSALQRVEGELSIRLTDGLRSLDGLEALRQVGSLRIAGNARLSQRAAESFSTRIRVDGETLVEGNAQP